MSPKKETLHNIKCFIRAKCVLRQATCFHHHLDDMDHGTLKHTKMYVTILDIYDFFEAFGTNPHLFNIPWRKRGRDRKWIQKKSTWTMFVVSLLVKLVWNGRAVGWTNPWRLPLLKGIISADRCKNEKHHSLIGKRKRDCVSVFWP